MNLKTIQKNIIPKTKSLWLFVLGILFIVYFLLLSRADALVTPVQPSNKDLILYYKFDEGETNKTKDYSGSGMTGTLTDMDNPATALSGWTTDGKVNGALTFAGVSTSTTNDNVLFTPSSAMQNLSSDLTASAWIYPTSINQFIANTIIRIGLGADLRVGLDITGTNQIRYSWFDGGFRSLLTGANVFTLNRWTHIAATKSGSTITIYVNGVAVSATTTASDPTVTPVSGRVGLGASSQPFNGKIDEVRFYNRALSASEIAGLAKSPTDTGVAPSVGVSSTTSVGLNAGLVGWWTFDGKTVTTATATDSSGSGNNGTRVNGVTVISGKIGQAMQFDGVDDAIQIPDNDALDIGLGSKTWSMWFKTATSSRGILYRKSDGSNVNGFLLDIGSTAPGKMRCWTHSAPQIESPTAIYNNTAWHNVTCILNRTTAVFSMYMDGILVATTSAANLAGIDLNAAGVAQLSASPFFTGSMDDVRIYNRALSASEALKLYQAGQDKVAVSSTVSASTTATQGINAGLVGYWTFDGKTLTAATATDSSRSGNDGTLIASPVSAIGKIGQALNFRSASSQYIDTGSSTFGITTQMTVSAWVKTSSTSTGIIISNARDCGGCGSYKGFNFLWAIPYSGLAFSYFDSAGTGPYQLNAGYYPPLNQWVLLTTTFNNKVTKIYANGQLIASGTLGGTGIIGTPFTTNTMLGRLGVNAAYLLNGALDDTRIYNRALSASEVLQLYKLGGR